MTEQSASPALTATPALALPFTVTRPLIPIAGRRDLTSKLFASLRHLPVDASAATTASPLGDWMRLSMPLLFIAVCYGLLTHCDLLMVGAFLSADQVAVYQAASRTAALVAFPLLALNALVAPMIARLYAEQRLDELQRSVCRATQMVFWPALAGGLLAIFGGGYILALFGPAFPVGHTALAILVVGHLVSVAGGPVTYLLTMTGHQNRCAIVWAGTVALQAMLNLLLIPRFGIEGAAVGTTLSTCVMTVLLTILAVSYTHLTLPTSDLV